MAKSQDLMSDYNLFNVTAVPAAVANDAETMVAALLNKKRENFNMMDSKTQDETLKKNPDYNNVVHYTESIPLGTARTTLQIQFIKMARQSGLIEGATVMDTALIDVLVRKSQQWVYSQQKRDPNAKMPNFLVKRDKKGASFYVAVVKSLEIDRLKAEPQDILAQYRAGNPSGITLSPVSTRPVSHEVGGNADPVSAGGPKFHHDVSTAQALSPEAQAAMDALATSRQASENAKLLAQIAKLQTENDKLAARQMVGEESDLATADAVNPLTGAVVSH